MERLESRQVLDGMPVITEFMALNQDTLVDEDGDSSDWIEMFNAGDMDVHLDGYFLSDDPQNLDRWRMPGVTLAPGEFLTVFASNKDRDDPAEELHTDFRLAGSGGFLALVAPDGATIVHQYAAYPPQITDISYGLGANVVSDTVLDAGHTAYYHIPGDGSLEDIWFSRAFDPNDPAGDGSIAAWATGPTGIGYDTGANDTSASIDLEALGINADFEDPNLGGNTSSEQYSTAAIGPGWTREVLAGSSSNFGVQDPPTSFFGQSHPLPAPFQGNQFGFVNLDSNGKAQVVSAPVGVLQAGGVYTLTVAVGARNNNGWGNGIYEIGLRDADGAELGTFATVTVDPGSSPTLIQDLQYTLDVAAAAPGSAGKAFSIVIRGTNTNIGGTFFQMNFDNVRLDVTGGSGATYASLIATDVETEMEGINASAYVRANFDVADPSQINQLLLDVQYDDGFVAYINGQEVVRRNAPGNLDDPLPYDAAATAVHPDSLAVETETIDISDFADLLTPGENLLAIHALNLTADNPDFLLVPRLTVGTVTVDLNSVGYLATATPSAVNSSSADEIGPIIGQVTHEPNVPTLDDPLIVTARVTPTVNPIGTVTLTYRLAYGGEISVAMTDDGTGSDAAAADGIYTGVIPAQAAGGQVNPGTMLRYYISADDTQGAVRREPAITDTIGTDQSPEYFGTVIQDNRFTTNLPVFQWFTQNVAASHSRTGTRASVFFNGEFYDNIFVRQRGGFTNQATSQKFDFDNDHLFFVNDTIGRVEEINLNGNGSDSTYLKQTIAYQSYRDAGIPSSESFLTRMQLNGGFDRVGVFIEQVDKLFLKRNGQDPDGALYKFVQRSGSSATPVFADTTTGIEKKTRLDEDMADIQAVVDGLHLPTAEQRKNFIFDNFNLPEIATYLSARAITQEADDVRKNFYLYRDTNGNREWSLYPWDKDWTFGFVGDSGVSAQHPFFGDFVHQKQNSPQWNLLLEGLFEIPEFREMYLRRLRTVMDEQLKPSGTPTEELYFENRIDALFTEAMADLALHGVSQSTVNGLKAFFEPRRNDLYNTHSIDNQGGGNVVATLIPEETSALWFVPSSNAITDWKDVADPANIAAWRTGQMAIGYENSPAEYAGLLNTTVRPTLGNDQANAADDCAECTSIYVRIPFSIADQAAMDEITANGLTLRMKFDDGFVAYFNGTEVARRNISGGSVGTPVGYNAQADNHPDGEAVVFTNINVSGYISELNIGANVLALHAVNQSVGSSDMLISPELIVGLPATGTDVAGIPHAQVGSPTIDFGPANADATEDPGEIVYDPQSGNQDEEYISLVNNNDTAVDISGWSLTGGVEFTFQPGTVIPAGGVLYVSPDAAAFRARATGPSGGQGLFVQGGYSGHISNLGETIDLLDGEGSLVSTVTTPSTPSDAQAFLRVTEIHYNPAGASEETEFLEFKNISDTVTLDLTGVRIVEGPSSPFDFTGSNVTSLAPGAFVLVVNDTAAFMAAYPAVAPSIIAGEFEGGLSNGGESIKVEDAGNGTVLEFKFEDGDDADEEDWPLETDGGGFSLVIVDEQAASFAWGSGGNWRSSALLGGSPGEDDPVALAADFNGDGKVDRADVVAFTAGFGATTLSSRLTGDTDRDRATTLSDLAVLQSTLGHSILGGQSIVGGQDAAAAIVQGVADTLEARMAFNRRAADRDAPTRPALKALPRCQRAADATHLDPAATARTIDRVFAESETSSASQTLRAYRRRPRVAPLTDSNAG